MLEIAPFPIITSLLLDFGSGFIFCFLCPVPECNIPARLAVSLAIPLHFYYLQLPYMSRKDSNEAVHHPRLKWSSLTHWAIICMHILTTFLFFPSIQCKMHVCPDFGYNQPRSLSFNLINGLAYKRNELLMINYQLKAPRAALSFPIKNAEGTRCVCREWKNKLAVTPRL